MFLNVNVNTVNLHKKLADMNKQNDLKDLLLGLSYMLLSLIFIISVLVGSFLAWGGIGLFFTAIGLWWVIGNAVKK